jgi:cytoskeletal protein CcmA (bactofilin family)
MAKNNIKEQETNGINLIGYGTKIEGDVNSKSDIRIDGELVGNVDTSGKLVIGESGKVDGEIKCKNGDISGTITGKVNVSELLSLKASAKVYGDMVVNKLAIDPGCIFTGNCKMDTEASEHGSKSKKERTAFEQQQEEPKAKVI